MASLGAKETPGEIIPNRISGSTWEEGIEMRKSIALAVAAMTALPAPTEAANVTIGGYIDVGWYDIEGGGTHAGVPAASVANAGVTAGDPSVSNPSLVAVGSTNGAQTRAANQTFAVNEVNVDITASLVDDMTVYLSFDAIPVGSRTDAFGTNALSVDIAYVEFKNPAGMPFTLNAGLIPTVIGYEGRVVESNQKESISRSLTEFLTYGLEVGVGIVGKFDFVNYGVNLVNTHPFGPGNPVADVDGDGINDGMFTRSAAAAPGDNLFQAINSIRPSGNYGFTGADFDNNRTVLGRIGVNPVEGLEIGANGCIGKYATPLPTGDREMRLVGMDVHYMGGPWEATAEYYNVDEDNAANPAANDSQYEGWYIEGAYRFGSIVSISKGGGLSVRYGEANVEVDGDGAAGGIGDVELLDISQLALAGWLDLSDDVRFKLEYTLNDEDLLRNTTGVFTNDVNNDVLATSVVATF